MSRRAAKVDANHADVVEAFRALGCTVQSLATVGKGCPDILVGVAGHNVPVEIKDGNGAFTPDQKRWHAEWAGTAHVVRNVLDVTALVQHYRARKA